MSILSVGLCGKLAKSIYLAGVHLLHWIVTYPVDKVICSLNNWSLEKKEKEKQTKEMNIECAPP